MAGLPEMPQKLWPQPLAGKATNIKTAQKKKRIFPPGLLAIRVRAVRQDSQLSAKI
jgi:hypothetical protein